MSGRIIAELLLNRREMGMRPAVLVAIDDDGVAAELIRTYAMQSRFPSPALTSEQPCMRIFFNLGAIR